MSNLIDPALYGGERPQAAPPARMMPAPAPIARPLPPAAKVKAVPNDDKMITMNYREYMAAQNQHAHNLAVYHQMATNQMYAASQHASAIQAAMLQLQNSIKTTLGANNVTIDDLDFGSFTALNDLLTKDQELISNPLAGFGGQRGLPIPAMLAGQPKKQRKARKPKDPNAPKRPITAFFLFSRETRDAARDQLKLERGTDDVKPGEVQKAIQDRWNAMGEPEQQYWKNKYLKEMERYRSEVEAWKKSGGGALPGALDTEDAAGEEDDEGEKSSSEEESSEEDESEPEKIPTPPPAKKEKKAKKKGETPAPEPIKKSVDDKKPKGKAAKLEEDSRKRKSAEIAADGGKKKKTKRRDTGEYGDDY